MESEMYFVATRSTAREHAPGPRFRTALGGLAAFRRDQIRYYLDATRYGDVVRFQMGRSFFHALYHPDHIQHVLQDNHQNYARSPFVRMMTPALGNGLFTSDGRVWLRQRRLAAPAFHRARIASFATMMTDTAQSLLARWRELTRDGTPLEIVSEMNRLTMDVTAKALFSTGVSEEASRVERGMLALFDHFNYRFSHFLSLPERFPTPRNRRFWKEIAALDAIVYRIIDEHRRRPASRDDLLAMLLEARDEETGESMTDKQLRDEVWTFMAAGIETTAVTLAWLWCLLSLHPDVASRLRAELASVLNGRVPTIDDLPKLKYTRMVIDEVLRLYPPVWGNSRETVADDEIGGYHIPKKSLIMFSPYVNHRDPRFWPNPEGFDPERFASERTAGRPRFAYFPFGGGPRLCLGYEFALMEATLVVATIAQQCRLHLVPGHRVEPYLFFTLRPRHGLLMTLHRAS